MSKKNSFSVHQFECPHCGLFNLVKVTPDKVRMTTCRHCHEKYYVEIDGHGNEWSWTQAVHEEDYEKEN